MPGGVGRAARKGLLTRFRRVPALGSYSIDSSETSKTAAFRWVSLPADATEGSDDLVRQRNVVDRGTINVQSFMVESRFCHHASFEYEYEYRCTEYEYDCPDEQAPAASHWRIVREISV